MKRKTRTKALSWLLSIMLMLGLLSGMSLTASADASDRQTPLTLEAKGAGSHEVSVWYYDANLKYSINGGSAQSLLDGDLIAVDEGDTVEFFGDGSGEDIHIDCDGDFYVYGNIMSLVDENDFAALEMLEKSSAFDGLFQNNSGLYNHNTKKLVLPATILTESCYANMFANCSNLTEAPEVPATMLASGCYSNMFYGCESLTEAPELPATTLERFCYSCMFYGCSSLQSVTCFATDISAVYATDGWLAGVAETGTFTKAEDMTAWTTGESGIPTGWTVAVPVTTPTTVEITAKDAYVDNDGLGNLRFVTEVNYAEGKSVQYFGTWFIPENLLTDTTKEKANVVYNANIESGKFFTADLIGIPANQLNRVIAGVSYLWIQGADEVQTDVTTATVNGYKNETSN